MVLEKTPDEALWFHRRNGPSCNPAPSVGGDVSTQTAHGLAPAGRETGSPELPFLPFSAVLLNTFTSMWIPKHPAQPRYINTQKCPRGNLEARDNMSNARDKLEQIPKPTQTFPKLV